MSTSTLRQPGTSSPAPSFFTTPTPFSSARDNWETPPEVFLPLDAEFGFTLDPCATRKTAKCRRFYTRRDDGLSKSWARERVFMNPPFGTPIAAWMQKARLAAQRHGATVVCLVPARTDTEWWHVNVIDAEAEVRFIRGRVRYLLNGKPAGSSPFPSALVIYRPRA